LFFADVALGKEAFVGKPPTSKFISEGLAGTQTAHICFKNFTKILLAMKTF
jgi:hypothetical protein